VARAEPNPPLGRQYSVRSGGSLFACALAGALTAASLAAFVTDPVAEASVTVPSEQYQFCMVVDELPGPDDLNRLFDHEPAGVVGADYQRATALPDGRVLWTFQDAAVRTPGGSLVTVHNIGMLQDRGCFSVLYRGTRAAPRPFLFADATTPFRRWFWPLDAAVGSDGRLYIYTAEMVERSDAYLVHTEPVGTRVAVFDPAANSVTEYTTPPDSSTALYGWSVADDGRYTYLYGHCYRQFGYDPYIFGVLAFDKACAARVTVARVPSGELWSPYEYWDGTRWQADPARAAALSGLAAQRVNASQFRFAGNRFWVVDKEGDWWGNTIYTYVSESPTGPFRQIAAVPEPLKCAGCNTFFADWIPADAVGGPGGSLVYGLSHNRWNGGASAEYRPTFHRVTPPAYPLRAGDTLRLRVPAASGEAGQPPPTAAALNVTAVAPKAAGHLTVHACDAPRPTASNLNFAPAAGAVANLVVTALDPRGDVCIYSHAAADVVVDLAGTFQASDDATPTFTPVRAPVRLVDTRAADPARVAPEGHVVVPVGTDAAVALNLTAVEPDGPGYLTAYACDQPRPTTSNVNYVGGQTVAVLAVARPDADGNVCVFSKAGAHVVVDLAGQFSGTLQPLETPTRLADTRTTASPVPLEGGTALGLGIPGAAPGTMAVLSVAAVDPAGPGHLTVYPCDQPLPTASNVNYVAATARATANLVFAPVSAEGAVCVFTKATTDVIVDLAATLPPLPAASYRSAPAPRRLIDTRVAGFDRG
jgi:hypothetical protein